MMGDKGEPIGVPKVCLYIMLLKIKRVEFKTSLTAFKNSDSGRSNIPYKTPSVRNAVKSQINRNIRE